MRGRPMLVLAVGVAASSLGLTAWFAWPQHAVPKEWAPLARPPRIRPDYLGAVIPPNIAPLNFAIEEPGTAYYVQIDGARGPSLAVRSSDGRIRIPRRPWTTLLAQNRGSRLSVAVYVRDADQRWNGLESFEWMVAQEEIDPYLVYRLLPPVFNTYKHMGIYQRHLESHDESPILFNAAFGEGCVNCHAFPNNCPDPFLLQVRGNVDGTVSPGTILVRHGKAVRLNTRTETISRLAGFTAWHPSGAVAAFALNDTVQYMHGTGMEVREVYDRDSDLAILDLRTGAVSGDPAIADPARLETFPCWSPDGEYLYFCSAPNLWSTIKDSLLKDYDKVQYDLMRIRYGVTTNTWGEPELLLASAETGKSMVQPRVSPDGKHLLFAMCDRGAFPAFRKDSDLYLMDLATRSYRRLQCNSPHSESWHSWSSNSRWIVFESRRDSDGLVGWPYLCYVDRLGNDHKPFLLPQNDPRFYDTRLKTYNVPELITGPLAVPEKELLQALRAEPPSAATRAPERPSDRE